MQTSACSEDDTSSQIGKLFIKSPRSFSIQNLGRYFPVIGIQQVKTVRQFPQNVLELAMARKKTIMRLIIAVVMLATMGMVNNHALGQEYGYGIQGQGGHAYGIAPQSRQAKSYREAYQDAMTGDKPLLVLVTANWCPPCQVMKQTTIPELMRKQSFKGFHYATVDLDQEKELAQQLIGSRGLPQLIMFEKEDGKWLRRYLRGVQSVETVEAFVAQASIFRTADAQYSDSTIDK